MHATISHDILWGNLHVCEISEHFAEVLAMVAKAFNNKVSLMHVHIQSIDHFVVRSPRCCIRLQSKSLYQSMHKLILQSCIFQGWAKQSPDSQDGSAFSSKGSHTGGTGGLRLHALQVHVLYSISNQ